MRGFKALPGSTGLGRVRSHCPPSHLPSYTSSCWRLKYNNRAGSWKEVRPRCFTSFPGGCFRCANPSELSSHEMSPRHHIEISDSLCFLLETFGNWKRICSAKRGQSARVECHSLSVIPKISTGRTCSFYLAIPGQLVYEIKTGVI